MAEMKCNVEITYDEFVKACLNKDKEALKDLLHDICKEIDVDLKGYLIGYGEEK